MTFKRLWQSFRLPTVRGGKAGTEYIRKQHVYGAIGGFGSFDSVFDR